MPSRSRPWQTGQSPVRWVAAAVKEILRRNGRPHSVELFGSIPTETTNRIPSLLPDAVVKQAYFDLLQPVERRVRSGSSRTRANDAPGRADRMSALSFTGGWHAGTYAPSSPHWCAEQGG